MRIVIDMQGAQTESRFRGIGRYSMALAKAMIQNAGEHEILVVLNGGFPEAIQDIKSGLSGILPEAQIIIFNVPGKTSWDNQANGWRRDVAELIREQFIADLEPDVVHISSLFEGANLCNFIGSIGKLQKSSLIAVTLYDLIPFFNPEAYLGADWAHQWYFSKVDYLKRADLLLSISGYAGVEARNALNYPANNIVNISSSHTNQFTPFKEGDSAKQKRLTRLGIFKPFLMHNGALESRKNLERLLLAFSLLPSAMRESLQLVLVGKGPDQDVFKLKELAHKLGVSEALVMTGHIDDEDLVALFSWCELFVFPSLHEGFGLPALEAMACGAPTIGSNTTSIPEVIGFEDALFDPTNPAAIAEKIIRVLNDTEFRVSLSEHALKQASKFSWDICGKHAIAAFEKHAHSLKVSFDKKSHHNENKELSYHELISEIANVDQNFIKPSEDDLKEVAQCIASNYEKIKRFWRVRQLPSSLVWRIEGPFDSTYSLALLNREMARALTSLGHSVALHSTEGPGDFPASQNFLSSNPDLANMYDRSFSVTQEDADITSRNLYPPRVMDMKGRVNMLHSYGWEESGFPHKWVEEFNQHLQGMTVMSEHVKKIMLDNGVRIPTYVSGIGVDHWERIIPDGKRKIVAKKFRFLHVSSCFPRKGVDRMLEAYGRAFTIKDEVTLIIKTFKNPHNEIHNWLKLAQAGISDYPDVLIIEEDYADGHLKALYQECHALVGPSRAEGFGLPMAEAMLSGLAVITTGWGGQLDFCNSDNSWLVDYHFKRAQSHFDIFSSVWADPDVEHLASTMLEVYRTPDKERLTRVEAGRKLLLENFRWVHSAKRTVEAAQDWCRRSDWLEPKIGWVTTWNTRCGIATYSEHLIRNMDSDITVLAPYADQLIKVDSDNVKRCWNSAAKADDEFFKELGEAIEDLGINVIVIQFNYAFFNLENLSTFLVAQIQRGRLIFITLHSTTDEPNTLPSKKMHTLIPALSLCHRVLVHGPNDMNRLKDYGLVDNVTLFPHGTLDYVPVKENINNSNNKFVIASYGFFLPHKGLLELIDAVSILSRQGFKVELRMINAMYPAPISAELIKAAEDKITNQNLSEIVLVCTEYLADDESISRLEEADLIIFPYQNTGESSSAAVRYGLASGRPVAVTPLAIFEDVSKAVHYLPGCSAEDIASGIRQIFNNSQEIEAEYVQISSSARSWREEHRYSSIGPRLDNMIYAILNSLK